MCRRITCNQCRESLGGRRQADIGLDSSLDILGCESEVLSHFEDATTKVLMIGSHCVMRAKGTIEGTDTCTEETGTLFNWKIEGLNMRRPEITVNKINLIERGKRHLHILCGIIDMDRVRFKFSLEESSQGRSSLGIIHSFVKSDVLCSLDLASLKIFTVCMSHRLCMSQEDTWTGMHINFSISRFGSKGMGMTTKCTKEREIGPTTSAWFEC